MAEPFFSDIGLQDRRPDGNTRGRGEHQRAAEPGHTHAVLLLDAFRLDDQISRSQQDVAEHDTERDENGKWREPIKRAAAEATVRHLRTLDQSAQDEALAQRRDEAAEPECEIPQSMSPRMLAELESDAAKSQREDHHDQRQVEGIEGDRIDNREGAEQRTTQE